MIEGRFSKKLPWSTCYVAISSLTDQVSAELATISAVCGCIYQVYSFHEAPVTLLFLYVAISSLTQSLRKENPVSASRKMLFGLPCAKTCQWSKVTRHVVPLIGEFELPSRRFEHIDIDLVTMPISNRFRYLFTAVDRFTRWPIPVPLGELQLSSYDCGISNFVRSTVLSNLLK